jgi:hypothetical protein
MVRVFEEKKVPLSDIKGVMCAWAGCEACSPSPVPHGWVNMLVWWSPKPATNLKTIWRHSQRDAVLCPEHARALDALLKEKPLFGGSASGEA